MKIVDANELSREIGDTFIDWEETPPYTQWVKIRNLLRDHGYEIVLNRYRKGGKTPGQGVENQGVRTNTPEPGINVTPDEATPTPDLRYIAAEGGLRRAIAGLVLRYLFIKGQAPLSYKDYVKLEEEADQIIEGQFPPYKRGRHEQRYSTEEQEAAMEAAMAAWFGNKLGTSHDPATCQLCRAGF